MPGYQADSFLVFDWSGAASDEAVSVFVAVVNSLPKLVSVVLLQIDDLWQPAGEHEQIP